MKHILSSRQLAFSVFLFMISTVMPGQDTNSCYKANKVADNVWAIVENNTVNIYLVEGKDSALIIDTGYGTGDLKAYIQTLTKLPVIVVNTHGHGDHAGNNHQFPKLYAHPEDFGLINASFDKERRKKAILSMAKDRKFTDEELEAMVNIAPPALIPIKEGYVFDLGGRRLEVIEVPGHTHGSICLLDIENKILFAGDNTNALVWLFLKDCYPLEVYLKSLQKVEKRMDEFNIIMPGHNTPLEKTFISEQTACVKSILDGTCSPVPYNYSSFTAGALLCKYKTSEVAYNPNNLFIKQ
jgi:hydroxyacylglutathione hydrolase